MKISIFVPAHNEEENIENVIRQIEKNVSLDHELVIVNDLKLYFWAIIMRFKKCRFCR